VRERWEVNYVVADALEDHVIVFQCPASSGPTEDNVAALYRFLERIETPLVKAWEPRGSWPSHLVEKV
jgi:uncharacterized protein YecE (DUF72 family)